MIKSLSEIGPKKSLIPGSHAFLTSYVQKNRRLYLGQMQELNFISKTADGSTIIPNLFRRTTDILTELVFSGPPTIDPTATGRGHEYLQGIWERSIQALTRATANALRYGHGVIVSDPFDPQAMVSVEPDYLYLVEDTFGTASACVHVSFRPDILYHPGAGGTDGVVDVFKYDYRTGDSLHEVYAYEGLTLGNLLNSQPLPRRTGPQHVTFAFNKDRLSQYDAMKVHVGEAGNALTALSRTISRNSAPHMYGPPNMLEKDSNGNYEINVAGMFLPIEDGDERPGYLQWDSSIEALSWDYEVSFRLAITQAGLASPIFAPDIRSGTILTGPALKLLLLNTFSLTERIKQALSEAFRGCVQIALGNRTADIPSVPDFAITWPFEDALQFKNPEGGSLND